MVHRCLPRSTGNDRKQQLAGGRSAKLLIRIILTCLGVTRLRPHKANGIGWPALDGLTGYDIEKMELGNVDRDIDHTTGFYA